MPPNLTARTSLGAHSEGGLGSYWRAVRVRWPLVVLVMLAALAGSLAVLSLDEREWEASAEILVTPLQGDDETFRGLSLLRDSGDPTRTVQTAATLLESPRAAEVAAQKVGAGWTRDGVASVVRVEPQGQSNVLAVTAVAGSPQEAAKLADEFAGAALALRLRVLQRQLQAAIDQLRARRAAELRVRELGGRGAPSPIVAQRLAELEVVREAGTDPTLSLSQAATLPTVPLGAPRWLVVAAALFAGLALGALAALGIEMLDRRVPDQDQLVGLYPLPVLAGIPRMSRRERRRSALPPPRVREAFRTLRVQLEQLGSARRILLTSASSGDGKTTVAANLGFALVEAGHRVVLVDFDVRRPGLAAAAGVESERGLVSVLGGRDIEDALVESPLAPGLMVLPAVEGDIAMLEMLARRLPEVLADALELPVDYVIVDSAPLGEVSDALGLAAHVDDVIVVARPRHTNRAGFQLMRGLLERTGVQARGLVVVGEALQSSNGYFLDRPLAGAEQAPAGGRRDGSQYSDEVG